MKGIPKKIASILLAVIMLTAMLPTTAFAAYTASGWTTTKPSGSVVSVYGTTTTYGTESDAILSGPLYNSKWYYQVSAKANTNNQSYTIPAVSTLFTIADGWTLKYVSVAGNSSGNRQPGSSILLSSSGASLVYYFEKTSTTYNYTLTYNANGGTGAPAAQSGTTADSTVQLTVSNTTPTRDGYKFLGWSTSSNASSPSYHPGGSITINGSGTTTLYAVWQEVPKDPEVAGYSTYNITKVFQGDYTQAPEGFGMTYSYTDLATNQTVTGTVELTDQDDGSLKGTISVPYYKNVATGTTYHLVLTETNAAVDGYDLSINGGGGTVSGNTVTYAVSATTESTWNRTITNTYTKKDVPADQYTVTYTDGVADATVFADQTYTVDAGGDTPGFEGTPSREGYTFAGWSPAVSPTVTGDVTYTALWTEDGDDDNEKVSEPGMDKKAGGENTIGAVTPGQSITFTLNSHVGQDMADQWDENTGWDNASYDLVFHDTLTGPISFQDDSLSVTIGGKTLSDTYYELDVNTDGKGFALTVDCVAALKASVFKEEDIGRAAVVVTYSAVVDEEAADGAEIKNEAYVNDSATDTVTGEVDGNTPPTPPTPPHTGGAGTLAFTTLGLTLMCGAAAAFVVRRKRA